MCFYQVHVWHIVAVHGHAMHVHAVQVRAMDADALYNVWQVYIVGNFDSCYSNKPGISSVKI